MPVALPVCSGESSSLEDVEQAELSAAAVFLLGLARLERFGQNRQELSPFRTQAVEGAGVDQRLHTARADILGGDALEEIVETEKPAALLPRLHDRLDSLESDSLDRD